MRRIGVLMKATADEDQQASVTAFLQVLQQLGWTNGCNVRIEFRWGEGNAERYRKIAAELVALAPDVIVALGTLAVGALQRTSRKGADRIRQWQVVQTDQSSGPRCVYRKPHPY
jgi:putative ABC transport system substrate-binding protein